MDLMKPVFSVEVVLDVKHPVPIQPGLWEGAVLGALRLIFSAFESSVFVLALGELLCVHGHRGGQD